MTTQVTDERFETVVARVRSLGLEVISSERMPDFMNRIKVLIRSRSLDPRDLKAICALDLKTLTPTHGSLFAIELIFGD